MCSPKLLGLQGSSCDKCTDKTMILSDGICSCPTGISTSKDGESCCSENCTDCITLRNGAIQKCNTCQNGFKPLGDQCICYGNVTAGVCTPCASGLYFNGLSCVDCAIATPHCLTCNKETGKCDSCSSPYELSADFTCECPSGQTDTGSSCVALALCSTGQYRNIDGNCYNCGTGCSSCDALTANCN